MALGALDALRARGYRVPEDVPVAGFDDIEEARFSTPALTTVRQPLYEQGQRAVETLLALLEGRAVPDQDHVAHRARDASVVSVSTAQRAARCAGSTPPPGEDELRRSLRGAARTRSSPRWLACSTRLRPSKSANPAEATVDAFAAELSGGASGAIIATFEETLRRSFEAGVDPSAWQAALSALRRDALRSIGAGSIDLRARAEDLLHELRAIAADIADAARGRQRSSPSSAARASSAAPARRSRPTSTWSR